MKKSILSMAAVISACVMVSSSPALTYAGTWLRVGQYWTYTENGMSVKNGWICDSEKIYYIDPATNIMVTGWKYIDGIPYLFGNDGALISGFSNMNAGAAGNIYSYGKLLSINAVNDCFMYGLSETATDLKSYDEISGEVYAMVNVYRAENGKNALLLNDTLSGVAMKRAEELSRNYSHIRPDGSRCFTLMKENGYSYIVAAENIAFGQTSSREAFATWINSSGHRRNILGDFTEIGIGVYKNNGTYYWVQEFGRK